VSLEEALVGPGGPLRDKATGLELTHPAVTELMAQLAVADGFAPEVVLDPAAGYGNFLSAITGTAPSVRRLVGYETDREAASAALGRLWPSVLEGREVEINNENALEACIEPEAYDLVISNPPYVRVHRLGGERERLRRTYDTARGRFDLYFLFFELATKALRPGGRLVIITSNKFMTTTAGGALRLHLRENYAPLRMIDFRDASPFRAAVLSMILVLEKGAALRPNARSIELERVSAATDPAVVGALARDPLPGFVTVPRLGAEAVVARVEAHRVSDWTASSAPWHLGGEDGDRILALLSEGRGLLSDSFLRFSVGIKTTADEVFIQPFDERTAGFGLVERDLLHPLIRGGSIARWRTTWDPTNGYDRYVLYPHEQASSGRTAPVDLGRYPRASAFLHLHHTELAAREYVRAAGRRWYEIWVPQQVAVMTAPRKLVFPDFAPANTFALELTGAFVGASAAFAVPSPSLNDDDLWYVLLLLNSPIYEYLHKRHFGTSILAKRYRYWTQHVQRYPLPWPSNSVRVALARLARTAAVDGRDPECLLEAAISAFELPVQDEAQVVAHVRGWLGDRPSGTRRRVYRRGPSDGAPFARAGE
jgi:adenine-specific DNA-methyltransferase